MTRRIAVMQPYLYPYPGYFQLLAAADCLVIFDCVQFNRRGRVHRVEMPPTGSAPGWLTLPLARQRRDVRICELEFASDARVTLDANLAARPWLRRARDMETKTIVDHLTGELGGVVDFLEHGLQLVARMLGLQTPVVRSSSLALPAHLRGQDRVLAIVRALQGTDYINPSGGRALYDPARFAAAGVGLWFLAPYAGVHRYTLPTLFEYGVGALADDVTGSLQVLCA
jgi:hypothetical protein